MMKVQVDREKCQGHNFCNMNCPEVYKIDADGYSFVETEEVAKELEEKARRGAEACPEKAITVTE